MLEGRSIDVYNQGQMRRDFTYIDDIVEGVIRVLDKPATPNPAYCAEQPDPGSSQAPFRLFNIGNQQPMPLLDFIRCIEEALKLKAQLNLLPMQDGDVPASHADVEALRDWVDYAPATDLRSGVARFVAWYRSYYRV
jgi:UDP-glucuronate 4-epimerase